MKKLFLSIAICCISLPSLMGATKYVSTSGSDSNAGTVAAPYATIAAAIKKISAGDTIYVRGGIYVTTAAISISTSGTDTTKRSCLFAYPGEHATLDFSSMGTLGVSGSSDGIKLSGSYWYIRGLDCKGAQHNGIHISGGSYNRIEFCSVYENRNAGMQLSTGASYNKIINCDSYYNRDSTSSSSYDGNADGFSPKLDVGTGNYFYGCRSWQNSDDGWDGYMRPADAIVTTCENCWCFSNGYLKSGKTGTGNGNGFKNGGGDNSNADSLRHFFTCKNCLSFCNLVKGFDQNNDRGSMTWINCSAYNNGTYNYSCPGKLRVTDSLTIINCISVGSSGTNLATTLFKYHFTSNSWLSPFTTAAASDFVSLDTTGVRGARKADGSLPDLTFMHLSSTSQYRNAGTLDPGATSKDLGAFAYATTTDVEQQISASTPAAIRLLPNYPNPFNPSTQITFTVVNREFTTVKVYDVLGRESAVLFAGVAEVGKTYSVRFDASHCASGVYFSVLQSGAQRMTQKMILMK